MLRHVIAPARFFSQVPNEIIRHPRLSSDAVRLLTWQLSLPADAKESLSRTAERAGIGKCAFLRAKRELKAEGYLHEWREQGVRGLWTTVQLVSNVPLTAEEAAAARAPANVPVTENAPVPVAATVPVAAVPAGGCPAAGEPTGRAVGRHPDTPVPENTSHHPAPPAASQVPQVHSAPHPTPADAERLALARQVVDSLCDLDRRLRVPRSMLPQLAELAAEWLACGHTAADVRECVRSALPGRGSTILRPGGFVRYVLRQMPSVVTAAAVSAPEPRIAGMRECEGRHDQALLFRPVADERLWPDCRCAQATEGAAHSSARPSARSSADRALTAIRGAAAVRAALRERAALIAPRPRHSLSENPVN